MWRHDTRDPCVHTDGDLVARGDQGEGGRGWGMPATRWKRCRSSQTWRGRRADESSSACSHSFMGERLAFRVLPVVGLEELRSKHLIRSFPRIVCCGVALPSYQQVLQPALSPVVPGPAPPCRRWNTRICSARRRTRPKYHAGLFLPASVRVALARSFWTGFGDVRRLYHDICDGFYCVGRSWDDVGDDAVCRQVSPRRKAQ